VRTSRQYFAALNCSELQTFLSRPLRRGLWEVVGVYRAVEVKCRADGFRELYGWLDDRDILIVKADRQEPLVVLRLSLAAS
jgi:hypothetical protein